MRLAVDFRFSARASVHAARVAIGALIVVIAVLDVVFRGDHRGIMTLLVAVPGLGVLLPLEHRRPLLAGSLAFGAALLLGGLEWRDRPIVVTGTLVNILLITLVTQRVGGPCAAGPPPVGGATSTAEPTGTDARRDVSRRLGDLTVDIRAVTALDQEQLRTVSYDVRATPFGTRLLIASFHDAGQTPHLRAASLLRHWTRAAGERSSLSDVARELDQLLASAESNGSSVNALLVGVTDEGAASVICCGNQPPLLLTDAAAPQPVNILTSLPPLGRFARTGHDLPIYTTSVRLTPGRRLLLVTDAPATDDAPHLVEPDFSGPGAMEPGAIFDQVAARLRERTTRPARHEALLALIEHRPEGASTLVPVPEDGREGQRHAPRPSSGLTAPAR